MQVQMYNQDTNQVAEAVKIIVDKKIGTVADYTWAQLFQQVCAEVEIARAWLTLPAQGVGWDDNSGKQEDHSRHDNLPSIIMD